MAPVAPIARSTCGEVTRITQEGASGCCRSRGLSRAPAAGLPSRNCTHSAQRRVATGVAPRREPKGRASAGRGWPADARGEFVRSAERAVWQRLTGDLEDANYAF